MTKIFTPPELPDLFFYGRRTKYPDLEFQNRLEIEIAKSIAEHGHARMVHPGAWWTWASTFENREWDAWYTAYLSSLAWAWFREIVLVRDHHRCIWCNTMAGDIHHITYRNVGFEDSSDCMSLCRHCHGTKHNRKW